MGLARPPEDTPGADAPSGQPVAAGWPRYQAWTVLMQRAFGLDVLARPRCGGRLHPIATIADPAVVEQIGATLALCLTRAVLDVCPLLDHNDRAD